MLLGLGAQVVDRNVAVLVAGHHHLAHAAQLCGCRVGAVRGFGDQADVALRVTARSPDGTIMGVIHNELPIEGVQFHPESIASEHGHAMIRNFLKRSRAPEPA